MLIQIEYKNGTENIVPDALSCRSDLLVVQEVPDRLSEPSDWPLLIPYIWTQHDIPNWVSTSLLDQASHALSQCFYDTNASTLCWISKEKTETSQFITFWQRADLMDIIQCKYGHRAWDGSIEL